MSIKEEYDTLSVWVRNSDEEADSFKANLATFQSLFDDISVYPVYFQKHNVRFLIFDKILICIKFLNFF